MSYSADNTPIPSTQKKTKKKNSMASCRFLFRRFHSYYKLGTNNYSSFIDSPSNLYMFQSAHHTGEARVPVKQNNLSYSLACQVLFVPFRDLLFFILVFLQVCRISGPSCNVRAPVSQSHFPFQLVA